MVPRPNVEAQRQGEILEAALRCFSRDGYSQTSMDAIAAEAGLSKALIYYYYKSKDAVFMASFDFWMTQMTSSFAALSNEGSAADRLRSMGQMTVNLGDSPTELFGLLLDYWSMAQRNDTLLLRFRQDLQAMRSAMATVLEDGVQQGEFAPMDTELTAVALFAALDGLWAHWVLDPDAFDLPASMQTTIDLFLRGLQKESQ